MSDCQHKRITSKVSGGWSCTACGTEFYPAHALDQRIADALDSTSAVMAAVMWDFHTRAVETYGPQVAAALEPEAHEPDDGHDHVWGEDDKCRLCKTPKFLGG